MADEVILLDFWASPYGVRVRVALAEKGVRYEYREENLDNRSPLLLQMNPIHKMIPVLVHNGKPVWESLTVLEYIDDEVWKGSHPLLASDPCLKARAKFWADFVEKRESPVLNQENEAAIYSLYDCGTMNILHVHEPGKKTWKTKGQEQEGAKKEFIESLKLLEGELGDKSYLGGENLGHVDIAFISVHVWSYSYEMLGHFSIEAEGPKFAAWAKRCMQKESVSNSLPDKEKIYGCVLELKKLFGIE